MDTSYYLDAIVRLFKDELSENLIGIYLHGSLAMGCFNPHQSDIDFIVIVKKPLPAATSRTIINKVLVLHDQMPNKRGMEFSVILDNSLKPFQYPTPFELHYSDFHKTRYQSDSSYLCGGFSDPDLAAQFSIAYYRGIALTGQPLSELYSPIARQHYVASILQDIETAATDIIENTMYLTLNLCRVLLYLQHDVLASKREGGEWGTRTLPLPYRPIVQACLEQYIGTPAAPARMEQQHLVAFAEYMLGCIALHR